MNESSMTTLAFDTSVIGASVALRHNNQLYSAYDTEAGMQASHLVTMLESVLHDAGIWYQQLDRLITTIGPGSFTGIRIGLATAQGIVCAQPVEVSILTSLDALAWQAHFQQFRGKIYCGLAAGKGEIVAQMFHVKQSGVETLDTPNLYTPEVFLSKIEDLQCFIGNGLRNICTKRAPYADIMLPDAASFIHAPLPPSGIEALVPYYVRPPDAKIPLSIHS